MCYAAVWEGTSWSCPNSVSNVRSILGISTALQMTKKKTVGIPIVIFASACSVYRFFNLNFTSR